LALTVYLTAECFLPPSSQPLARLGVAMIHGYQATGSKVMQSSGVHCRYEPSCSHYAEDAISHYGTVSGLLRTCGRLWRCSPWGGSGASATVCGSVVSAPVSMGRRGKQWAAAWAAVLGP